LILSTRNILILCCCICSFGLSAQKKDKNTPSSEAIIKEKQAFFLATKEKLTGTAEKAIQAFIKVTELNPENDAAWFELSRLYAEKGRALDAKTAIENALELSPDNYYYQSVAADVYVAQGDTKKAIKLYEDILKQSPDKLDLYLTLARIYEQTGNEKKAEETYANAKKFTGAVYEIASQKLQSYLESKDYTRAAKECIALIEEYPDYIEFKELLGDIYLMKQDADKALEAYTNILKDSPDEAQVQLKLSRVLLFTGKLDDGFAMAQKAFSNHDLDIDAKMEFLLVLFDLSSRNKNLNDRAHPLINALIVTHPKNAKSYSIAGDYYQRESRYEEALAAYKLAVSCAPDKVLIWQQIVELEAQLSQWDSLKVDAARTLELFPNQPGFYMFSGIAYTNLEAYDQAIAALENGLDLLVDNKSLEENFYFYLASAHEKAKNFSKCDSYFEKALKLNPNNALLINNYAYSLAQRGQNLNKALELAQKANQLIPLQASFLDTKGWVQYKLKNYSEALEILKVALDAGGDVSGEVLDHYGDALYQNDRKEEALTYWKKAKELGVENPLIDQKINTNSIVE